MQTRGLVCLLSTVALACTAGPAAARVLSDYGKIPMVFEPNLGQAPKTTKFYSRGASYTVLLEDSQAVLLLRGSQEKHTQMIRLSLTGGNRTVSPEAEQAQQGHSNYLMGSDPGKWVTDVPHYNKVRYPGVYRGVDLVFYGNQRNLEYDFVVAPGADPKQIRFRLDGARAIRLDNASGDLILDLPGGSVRQHKPIVYQGDGADKQLVSARYVLTGRNIRFEIGAYDRTKPLIIDPIILAYWAYIGGSNVDSGEAITVDSAGNAYIAGLTHSSTGFQTVSAVQTTFGGGTADAFVTKINAAGTAILYSTYFGGSGGDFGRGIGVDSAGNAYITGETTSTNLPGVTAGSLSSTLKGAVDAFVVKLNPSGNGIVYASYLGGNGNDAGFGIAVDANGYANVAGVSTSSANFVGMNPATFSGGLNDGFLMRLNPAGNAAVFGVFVGGAGADVINSVALDGGGNAYLTGLTTSAGVPGAIGTYAGANDAFVAKYSAASGARVYWSYLGGALDEQSWAVAVDSIGNAYIAGETNSPNLTVLNPLPTGATYAGNVDAFAAKFNVAGGLVYSTYLGGTNEDRGFGIAVNGSTAYIAGHTQSANFPLLNQIRTPAADRDAFLTQLSPAGNSLLYSTAVGGNGSDQAVDIAVDAAGAVYMTGLTWSTNVPSSVPGNVHHGTQDGFMTKLTSTDTTYGHRFFPLTPCRVVDTREARPAPFGAPLLSAGVQRNIPVPASGCPGIPSNAIAYAVNATVIPAAGTLGFLTLWPTGEPMPLVSTLNAYDGFTVANNAIVPVGSNASISAIASHNTHLILDINGYFAPAAPGQGKDFVPITPCRVADSREARPAPFGVPQLAAGAQRNYPLPASGCAVPSTAAAFALNATAVPTGFLGFITLWPTGGSMPLASTLNGYDGNVIANGALVPAGPNGSVSAVASNATHLILDVNGYFPASPGTGFQFHPVPPCRIVDTRENRPSPYGTPFMGASTQRDFPVPAAGCGIPAAAAYSINVTVVPRGTLGFVTVWPTGDPRPLASTLNAPDGNVVANGTIVRAGTNSAISLFVSHATDVIIDVNGYFGQ